MGRNGGDRTDPGDTAPSLPPPPDRTSGLNGSVYGRSLGTYIFDLYPQFFNSTPSELRYF